jgi:hypothetical protein
MAMRGVRRLARLSVQSGLPGERLSTMFAVQRKNYVTESVFGQFC